jgi:antitoxin MazE
MIYGVSVYPEEEEGAMRVAKWGNSLAVRLPQAVVETLGLREGDEIEITVSGRRLFKVARDVSRERVLKRLRKYRRRLPAGFKFDREEAHARR